MKIKHVGTKMLLVLIISVVLSGVISAGVTYFGNKMIIDNSIEKNTDTSVKILSNHLASMQKELTDTSFKIANTYELQNALVSKNKSRYDSELIAACQANASEASFVSLFDENGNELARFENGGYSQTRSADFSRNEVIKSAVQGKKLCSYTEGFGSKFVICAATPMTDSSGKVSGGVALVYKLDDFSVLDELKELSGAEFTIFAGTERINTTFEDEKGHREIGTEMTEEIMNTVLGDKSDAAVKIDLFGNRYNAKYIPIIQNDEAIGAVFSGNDIVEIENSERNIVIISFIVVFLICLLSSVVSFIIVNKVVVSPIKMVGEIVQNIAEGKLRGKLLDIKGYDEISELARNTNITAVNLSKYINDIIIKVDALASKDISISFDEHYVGDYIKIENSLKKITDVMNKTFQTILLSCDQVSIGSEQIAIGAQALAQGATSQAAAVEQLSNSVRKLNNRVKESVVGVERVENGMNGVMNKIREGTNKMSGLLESMAQITASTNQISSIIRVIDDISFQTNILALNAAVEAESAGAAGKGFAVVASEVQKLSEKTAAAVKETDALINQSIKDVKKGSVMLKDTATAIDTVSYDAENINVLVSKIGDAFKIQLEDIDDITRESENITQVIQTNSATSEESAAASEELSGQAALLRDKLKEFKFRDDDLDFKTDEIDTSDATEEIEVSDKYTDNTEEAYIED